ncbi:MAG: diguanylate cyclase [Sulfuricurvum sp.]|nr:diguanylate cyclase [Sulfuricurvum sp.]
MNKLMRNLILMVILFFGFAEVLFANNDSVVIGVLAFRSKADTAREWEPLAQYLHQQIPDHDFTIRPLSYKEFNKAVEHHELDFAFTNPEHYVYFTVKYHATRIATLIRANVGGVPLKEFGGVVIARSDRHDITQIRDLKNKKIAAVDKLSLGGYLAQSSMLLSRNFNVKDDAKLFFTDMPHDKVVYAVLHRFADVGFIRTGVLEKMAKEGKISLSDFKILHPMHIDNFPQALSTLLYPEWPFAAFKETDPVLANDVAVALLNLPYGSEIAKNAGYYGWSIPLAYEGIRILMEELRAPPFENTPSFTVKDVIQKYAMLMIGFLGFVIVTLSILMWYLRKTAKILKCNSTALEEQIAVRKEAEIYLKRAANVFHNSHEGIVITDAKKNIIDVNEAFCELSGFTKEEVIGRTPILLRSNRHEMEFYDQMNQALAGHGSWRGEIWNRKKNGEEFAEYLRIDSVRDGSGKIENFIGIFSDITEHKKQEEQLHHMANYDPLTNLPNRHLYMTLSEQILALSKRKGSKAIIGFLDLDGFKGVNDHYGHSIGDYVLKKVASLLERQMRQSDIIARLGGDEFVLLLTDVNTIDDATLLLERILASLTESFSVEGLSISIGASIGATVYPDDSTDIDILIRYADAAMYRSKEDGRNRITYFHTLHGV